MVRLFFLVRSHYQHFHAVALDNSTPINGFDQNPTAPLQPMGQIFQPQPRTTSNPMPPPDSFVQRSGTIQGGYDQPPGTFGPGQVMRNPSFASSVHNQRPPNSAPPSIGPGGVLPHSMMNDFHPNNFGQYGPPIPRPPSEPPMEGAMLRKSPSAKSLNAQYVGMPPIPPPPPPVPNQMRYPQQQPPMFNPGNPMPLRNMPPGGPPGQYLGPSPLPSPSRPMMPSDSYNSRSPSAYETSFADPSPPNSPVQETRQLSGPVTSTVSATMKCKVFLKQHHAQWKSLGSARLRLYHQAPTNIKQLVVEAEDKNKTVLISTIVLSDGVERVGKTGVAIELSDRGARTGIVYMIQLRNEKSAGGLFESLLAGSDRHGL